MKRFLAIFFSVLFVCPTVFFAAIAADTANELVVTVQANKSRFSLMDTAIVTVSVENKSTKSYSNAFLTLDADNWLLTKDSNVNILDLGTLAAGSKRELTIKAVVNRKAKGILLFSRFLLWFRDLSKKPVKFLQFSLTEKNVVSSTTEFRHGGVKVQVTGSCWYDKNGAGGWTNNELKNMESVDSQIQALTSTNAFSDLNAGDQKNQVSDLLNNLQQDKLIQTNSVFWDNDAQAYVFSYIDGALGGVLLKKFGDDFNGSQSKDMPCTATFVDSAASPDAAASVGEALLLYSFNGIGDDQNKRDPFYVSTVSSWNSAGLQTTRDKSVTVNDLKKIDAKYDIVCFNGHGGTIDNHTVMALTEKVTSSNRQTYATDLKNQRIMIATNTYGETVYVVFPSLFTATYGASGMKNKFIFSECCCFFGENNKYNESFANAFLMAGAQAIVGFHNSVEAVYCRNFMKYWVDSLVAGKTAKQAFDTCVSKYGKDDGQPKKAAIPNFRGNNNAKLRSGSDPNNPVHTGDLIEFGSYPQRRVMDDSIIASLNALAGDNKKWTSYGYYEGSGKADGTMTAKDYMRYTDIVYNGNKYRGVIFDAYRPTGTSLVWPTVSDSKYSFLDNSYSQQYANGYRTETVYWFEFDAIEWRVLDPNSGLVMANKVLDSQPYNNLYMVKMSTSYGDESESYYANNYERSSIRQWLNNDFYNTAFSSEERKLVHTATLDNSENHSGTSYSSGTTTDKVFLLSRKETLNDAYGFSTKTSEDEIRTASGTSYARCQGLGYGGNGVYWLLRTPTVDYSGRIFVIGNRGAVHPFVGVTQSTFIGIRPAMTLAHF